MGLSYQVLASWSAAALKLQFALCKKTEQCVLTYCTAPSSYSPRFVLTTRWRVLAARCLSNKLGRSFSWDQCHVLRQLGNLFFQQGSFSLLFLFPFVPIIPSFFIRRDKEVYLILLANPHTSYIRITALLTVHWLQQHIFQKKILIHLTVIKHVGDWNF